MKVKGNSGAHIMTDKNFIFKNPTKVPKELVLKLIESHDSEMICNTLIATIFYENDIEFCMNVIQLCFALESYTVRATAVLCLGHLARIHGSLEEKIATNILQKALIDENEFVKNQVENVLDDIEIFIPKLADNIKFKLGL